MKRNYREDLALFVLLKKYYSKVEPPIIHEIESWEEQSWFSTGGTRAKKYIVSPQGKYYYFKRSQFKPDTDTRKGKDFKYEFWSEIIAYQIGTLLGFDVLRYDIAIEKDRSTDSYIVGCICESMINSDEEELMEGIKYLQGFDPSFQPEQNANRSQYSFQLIESALDKYRLEKFKTHIIEVIVFDALIGNGDRHQENWAVISEFIKPSTIKKRHSANRKVKKQVKLKALPDIQLLRDLFASKSDPIEIMNELKLYFPANKTFAPIYDSGSSLGRELTEERVLGMIADTEQLKGYVNKGKAEIHWEGKKITHFDLVNNLINSQYKEMVITVLKRIEILFDYEMVKRIIDNIDFRIPDNLIEYKLPKERKNLILNIITLRSEILKGLLNERIR